MCTLTIRQKGCDLLVTMNRDEKKARSKEKPLHHWPHTGLYAPQDTKANGTWAGINNNRHIACLLNGYEDNDPQSSVQSRGNIIPFILGTDDPYTAIQNLEVKTFSSFHLVLIQDSKVSVHSWDCKNYISKSLKAQEWYFFTSSSWNQDAVKTHRQDLFHQWVEKGADFIMNVPSVHLGHNTEQGAYSILMEREDARTQSITQFDCTQERIHARYWADPKEKIQDYTELVIQ